MTRPKAIMLEIDGVLSDDNHRRHFIDPELAGYVQDMSKWAKPYWWLPATPEKSWEPDYEAYHAACNKDRVNEWCVELLQRMAYSDDSAVIDFEIIFISARPEKYWQISFEWIRENLGGLYFNSDFIFMRPDYIHLWGPHTDRPNEPVVDNRPSYEVKREIYEREIKDKFEVLFVLEKGDDAAMYRELGLTVLEVK